MFNKITVEIFDKTRTQDSLGLAYKNTYTKLKDVKGYLDYLSGSDKYIFEKFKQETTHIFIVLNKQEDIKTNQLLKYQNNYYLILNVDYPVQAQQTEILLKFIGVDVNGV